MRDEDKPFICYQQGKWNFRIVPRNAEGWRGLGLWLIPFFAATAGFVALTVMLEQRGASDSVIIFGLTLPFLAVTLAWCIAMIRWMRANSQIIDMNAVAKFQQDQERQAKKRGRS